MNDNNEQPKTAGTSGMVIPAFGNSKALTLDLSKTKEAEIRLIEAKTVNPSTYTDLEHCFNESYRELKRHYSTLGHELAKAEKALRLAKSVVLLDKYPEFIKDKKKTLDNSDMRDAFLIQDQDYSNALDRINMLKAMESFVDGRIKVIENVSRYMKKGMDLIIRSGLSGANLYNTNR